MRLVGAGDSLDDHISRAAEGKLDEHATEQVRRELTRLHEKFYLRKYEVSPHPAYILFHVANLLHRKQGQYFSSIVGVVSMGQKVVTLLRYSVLSWMQGVGVSLLLAVLCSA